MWSHALCARFHLEKRRGWGEGDTRYIWKCCHFKRMKKTYIYMKIYIYIIYTSIFVYIYILICYIYISIYLYIYMISYQHHFLRCKLVVSRSFFTYNIISEFYLPPYSRKFSVSRWLVSSGASLNYPFLGGNQMKSKPGGSKS